MHKELRDESAFELLPHVECNGVGSLTGQSSKAPDINAQKPLTQY